MGKLHQSINYLKGLRPDTVQAAVPEFEVPEGRTPVPRLCWHFPTESGRVEQEGLAGIIGQRSLQDAQFFLDTGFLTGQELSPGLWAAIRSRSVFITPLVWQELQPWINNPFVNLAIRDELVQAKQNGAERIHFLPILDASQPRDAGIKYYIELLSFRKRAFELVQERLEVRLGRKPSEAELEKEVLHAVRDRGWRLADKGRKDQSKTNFLADEATVVRAVASALHNKRETIILTRDNDLLEQFYKFVYLLETHYRSMLLASAYSRQPLNFREEVVPEGRVFPGFHKNTAKILHLPIVSHERVLPRETTSTILYGMLLGDVSPPWKFDMIVFNADHQMDEMFEMKGKTKGKNTELFGELNFHRCINPMAMEELGSFSILAKDRIAFECDKMQWAEIDVEMVLRRFERASRVQYVAKKSDSDQ